MPSKLWDKGRRFLTIKASKWCFESSRQPSWLPICQCPGDGEDIGSLPLRHPYIHIRPSSSSAGHLVAFSFFLVVISLISPLSPHYRRRRCPRRQCRHLPLVIISVTSLLPSSSSFTSSSLSRCRLILLPSCVGIAIVAIVLNLLKCFSHVERESRLCVCDLLVI